MSGRRRKQAARGPLPPGEGPVRTCVGCGRRDRRDRLVRIGKTESGSLGMNRAGRGGRGAYLHPARPCVTALRTSKLLRRSLRIDVGPEERAEIGSMIDTVRSATGGVSVCAATD